MPLNQLGLGQAIDLLESIKEEGVLRSCTGDGKIPFIHPQDVAEIATRALTSRGYIGESLPITGPEALSYAEMAARIGVAIGKELRFEAISSEQVRDQMLDEGDSEDIVAAHLSIYQAIRQGHLARVTDMAERVLGRKPITFNQWVRENVAAFADPALAC